MNLLEDAHIFFVPTTFDDKALQAQGPREWSYLGDAVASLYVRARLVEMGVNRDISGASIRHVSAAAQAGSVRAMEDALDPQEHAIYRRGRNAKIGVCPRNIDPALYSDATGYETLIGYLYCKGEYARMEELLSKAFDAIEEACNG